MMKFVCYKAYSKGLFNNWTCDVQTKITFFCMIKDIAALRFFFAIYFLYSLIFAKNFQMIATEVLSVVNGVFFFLLPSNMLYKIEKYIFNVVFGKTRTNWLPQFKLE